MPITSWPHSEEWLWSNIFTENRRYEEKFYPNFKVFNHGFEGYKPGQIFFFFPPNLELDYICLRSLQSRETKQPFMPRKPFVRVPGKDRKPIQTNDGGTIWACMTAVKKPKFAEKQKPAEGKWFAPVFTVISGSPLLLPLWQVRWFLLVLPCPPNTSREPAVAQKLHLATKIQTSVARRGTQTQAHDTVF